MRKDEGADVNRGQGRKGRGGRVIGLGCRQPVFRFCRPKTEKIVLFFSPFLFFSLRPRFFVFLLCLCFCSRFVLPFSLSSIFLSLFASVSLLPVFHFLLLALLRLRTGFV